MIEYKEIIKKVREYGKVYYFVGKDFNAQEEKIEKLVKEKNRTKVISSIEEFYDFKFEKFKLIVLKNAEKITKTSRFLLFFNEKIEYLELEKKWKKFRKEEKKNLIECNKINARTKTPWQHIKEFIIQYKKNILRSLPLIYFLIIFLGSALFGLQFFPFLISSLVFGMFLCPLIFAAYKTHKGPTKKWRVVSILYDTINIALGLTVLKIAMWVYSLLATK